jgi:hypothetical protein
LRFLSFFLSFFFATWFTPLGQRPIDDRRQPSIDRVTTKRDLKRLGAAVAALRAETDPIARLALARRIREAADSLEASEVASARDAGATWVDIGAAFGLTKQGAQQRFRPPKP